MASNVHSLRQLNSLEAMLATIPSLPRPVLSRLVQQMIDHMDSLDPDPDLEREEDVDSAHDDGCGPVYIHGRAWWGSEYEATLATRPMYGEDQSAGPVNLNGTNRNRCASAARIVRRTDGGWALAR